MVRYEVSGFREQGTVAGRSEMMPNFRILHLYEKRCKQKAIVGQNGRIELPTTELTEGTVVEVIVLVEADPEEDEIDYLLRSKANKKQLMEALENVKQGITVAINLDEYEKNYL
jgi:antitoxin YefM